MPRDKILKYCNKIIEISLYAVAFYIPISTAIIESFITLALFAWLIKKIIAGRKENLFYSNFLSLPILLFLLASIASTIFSSNHNISLRHLIFKTTEYLLLFFIVAETIDKRILRNILIAVVSSACLVAIDGVAQFFTHFDFIRHRNQVIANRVNGPFSTPNDFGNYIVTLLPLAASLSFLKFKRPAIKIIIVIIPLIIFVSLVFSTTRSAWVAFLLAMPFVAILGNRRLLLLAVLLITIVLSFISFLPDVARFQLLNFFDFNKAWTSLDRQMLWKMGFQMFLERPVFGQGLGTFMYNFQRFKPSNYPDNWGISYAHNCILQIVSEMGITGLLSFILVITVLFYVSLKLLRRIRNHSYYYILSGLLISIFTYLASSFFDTNLYSVPLAVLFWFMLGLTVGLVRIIKLESQ